MPHIIWYAKWRTVVRTSVTGMYLPVATGAHEICACESFPDIQFCTRNLSYCNSFIMSISRSIVDNDGGMSSILTYGHIWTQITRKLIVLHRTTFILLSRGLEKFMWVPPVILGVVKRNPLFLHEIEWKNNGFLFITPNICFTVYLQCTMEWKLFPARCLSKLTRQKRERNSDRWRVNPAKGIKNQ